MNGQTLTWSQDELYRELVVVRNQVDRLIDKVLSLKPPKYGGDAWWEQETQKSLEDYKKGRYITLKNKTDIDKFFANL